MIMINLPWYLGVSENGGLSTSEHWIDKTLNNDLTWDLGGFPSVFKQTCFDCLVDPLWNQGVVIILTENPRGIYIYTYNYIYKALKTSISGSNHKASLWPRLIATGELMGQ